MCLTPKTYVFAATVTYTTIRTRASASHAVTKFVPLGFGAESVVLHTYHTSMVISLTYNMEARGPSYSILIGLWLSSRISSSSFESSTLILGF